MELCDVKVGVAETVKLHTWIFVFDRECCDLYNDSKKYRW